MRAGRCAAVAVGVLAALGADVSAEPGWTYRARVTFEAQGAKTAGADGLVGSRLMVGAADSSWERGRVRLAGGLVASDAASARLRAREAYARLSAASWMDVEAGKRLVRWGVGYGFSPTGVLDPPRIATDPTDRLGRNEGMPLVRADLFRGDTSLTIAVAWPAAWRPDRAAGVASRVLAARARTVLPGGLEVAIVASAAPGRRVSAGGNVTHVIGQRLEWHGELLLHDDPGVEPAIPPGVGDGPPFPAVRGLGRTVSAVAGVQYTLPGMNVVMEYHRRRPDRSRGEVQGHQLFLRAARAGADVKLLPELIVVRAMDGGRWTTVAGVGWMVRPRFEIYGRAVHVRGLRVPAGNSAPSATLSAGTTFRF